MRIGAGIIFVLLSMGVSMQTSFAQLTNPVMENWSMLASRPIDYSLKRDSIHFTENKEYFTALKFLVKNAPIQMGRCTVYFTDGTQKDADCIEKSIENESLVDRLKHAQKDLDDMKLLNQNLGKQLSEGDNEYNVVVERLQKDMEKQENALVEKNRQMDELKERANMKAENLNAKLKQADKALNDRDNEYNKLREV